MPFNQRSLTHQEAWLPPCFVRQNQPKKTIFFLVILDHFLTKMFKSETTSFHHFFPKDSESLEILDIPLQEVGAKRPFNGTSKVNGRTPGQTDTQTNKSTYRKHRPRGPMLRKEKNINYIIPFFDYVRGGIA